MDLERIFKNLVLAFPVFSVLFVFMINWDIPVELDAVTTTIEMISMLSFVIFLINLYFLYKFKPIGKTLFIPLCIIVLLSDNSVPYENIQYMKPGYEYMETTFEYIAGVVDGMIIALLYFTDIKNKFKKT